MDLLVYIINTLDSVEVKGKENMTKMLGCISALEELRKSMNNKAEKENESEGESEAVENG